MTTLRPTRASARLATAVALCLLGGLVAPVTSSAGPAAPTRPAAPSQEGSGHDDTSLKAEYDEVLGEEAELIAAVQAAQAEQLRLTAELQQLEADVLAKQWDLAVARHELAEAEATVTRRVAARETAERRVEDAVERLRKQIVASYVSGGQSSGTLEVLLQAADTDDLGIALTYSNVVVGDTEQLLRELEEARAEQRRAESAARAARARAEERRDEVEAAAAFITAARDEKKALVEQKNVQIVAEALALQEVRGRKALVESRITAMARASDGVTMLLAAVQAGQPDWFPGAFPTSNPLPGYRIGSRFGMRVHPILGTARLHAGGDMGAPSGTPIRAAADGVVVFSGDRGGYGNVVVIDHGHSLGTLYAHQSRVHVAVGQVVLRGQVIGEVGSTGLSTGPHLHFETRLRGAPIDPLGVVDFEAEVPDVEDAEAGVASGN